MGDFNLPPIALKSTILMILPASEERSPFSGDGRPVNVEAVFFAQSDAAESGNPDFFLTVLIFDEKENGRARVHLYGNLKLVLISGQTSHNVEDQERKRTRRTRSWRRRR